MQAHVTRSCMLAALATAVACTMPNPAFDQSGGTENAGDGEPGDGDGEPGDGDGTPGDGDGAPGDGDGAPGDGDGAPGDGDGDCLPPLMDCSGDCVDLDTSAAHCGGCNSPCIGLCEGGSCDETAVRVVFVTSQPIAGKMGGLEAADAWCMELAGEAALEGEFKAWLSTAEIGPSVRMTHFSGSYRLVDGTLIAMDWADLTDGTLAHPINLDQNGEMVSPPQVCEGHEVWTNTKPDGTPFSNNDCGGWHEELGTSMAGQFMAVDETWTQSRCIAAACFATLPLYCVQQ